MSGTDNLPAAASADALRQKVSVHVGDSCLTRDLVWCECGRGLSRNSKWLFCPNCGHPIDQASYAAACIEAEANGRMHFTYHDADLVNEVVQLRATRIILPVWLMDSAKALLQLDASNSLVPHGIGEHARRIIEEFVKAHDSLAQGRGLTPAAGNKEPRDKR